MNIRVAFLLLLQLTISTILVRCKSSKSSKVRIPLIDCKKETIGGHPAYFCYRRIDGRRIRQGIFIHDKNNYYCGQFEKEIPKGKGFLFLGNSTDSKIYCGDVLDGLAEGYGANQFVSNKQFIIGRFSGGFNIGPSMIYVPSRKLSARVQYEKGVCQSAIWRDQKGVRMKMEKDTCVVPKKW